MEVYTKDSMSIPIARNDDDDLGMCLSNIYASFVSIDYDDIYSGHHFLRLHPYEF